MGQMISDNGGPPSPPPNEFTTTEPYYPYDVNAWRRLSQQYLDQLAERGDWAELEWYWKNGRHRNSRSRLKSAASTGSIGAGFADYTPKSLRTLKNSSHLTKNNRYRYHSLANLNRITLTKDQLQDMVERDFRNKYGSSTPSPMKDSGMETLQNDDSINRPNWTPPIDDSSFDSSSGQNSSSHNQSRSGNSNNSEEERKRQEWLNQTGPKMFQEYQPKFQKSPEDQRDYVQLTFDDIHRTDPRSNESTGFIRDDPSRNTSHTERTQRSFTPEMHRRSNELLVQKNPAGKNRRDKQQSSFHRKQNQSKAPEFRINSKEKIPDSTDPLSPHSSHQIRSPFQRKNRNSYNRAVGMEDEHYPGYSEDDDLGQRSNHQRLGSRRLMRNKNTRDGQDGQEMLLWPREHPGSRDRGYIPYQGYYLDPDRTYYSRYYQNFDRPRLTFTKIAFIVLLVANAAATIWQSIYLHFAVVKIKLGEPLEGKLYAMSHTARNLWQTAVITVLVLNCITVLVAIYAAIRQRYWILWIITVLFYLISAFGAFTEFQRGSVTAWLIPMACGHAAIILTHQTAINHYSV